jgi:hypothetical protein
MDVFSYSKSQRALKYIDIVENGSTLTLSWEQGDISGANGSLQGSTTVLRTNRYYHFDYQGVTVTPSNGYKCGYRAYTLSNGVYTFTTSNVATANEFEIDVDSTYYYKFVIAQVSGDDTAVLGWADNITFTPVTAVSTLESNVAEYEYISPDYETITLPALSEYWQGITIVGGEIWLWTASTDDYSTDPADMGYVYCVDVTSWLLTKTLRHNLGHVNSMDYDVTNDRIITGTASDVAHPTPKLFIFDNVTDWASLTDGQSILYASVDATDIDLSGLEATYGNLNYINGCWGESSLTSKNIVYVNASVNTKQFKLVLGTGTTQLTYGTYAAASAGDYNGTFNLIWYKTFTNVFSSTDEVVQGMTLCNGRIWTIVGHQCLMAAIWKPFSGTTMRRSLIDMPIYSNTGVAFDGIGTGIVIKDGYAYISIKECVICL